MPDASDMPIQSAADDGEIAQLLTGRSLPPLPLAATDGTDVDLSTLDGLVVVYAYPRTSPADGSTIDGWDVIPGARGCTPQSCAFRDHAAELHALGVKHLFGLSTQDTPYQQEAAGRLHLPFPLLSDSKLHLAQALGLPTFAAGGLQLLKRLTMVIDEGRIRQVFYPVSQPARNAEDVMEWLASHLHRSSGHA